MPFVGLVSDPRWEPPDGSGDNDRNRRRTWRVPWSLIIWITLFIALMRLVPVASDLFGAFAGYLLLCGNVALGFWRVDRWFETQYWRGLRDYQA
jgi:hypothetical protein